MTGEPNDRPGSGRDEDLLSNTVSGLDPEAATSGRAVRFSREEYRLLFDASPVAVWVNADGRIAYINRAGVRTLHASSPDEILGRSPFDFVHPDFHEMVRGRIAQALLGTAEPAPTEKFVCVDGSVIDVEVTAWGVPFEGTTAVHVSFCDVTEQRRATEAMHQLAVLTEFSHDAIIMADPNRIITGWNSGAANLYGWTAAEALGRKIHELLQTRIHPAIEDVDLILREQGHWEGEILHTRSDSAVRVVESRQVLMQDAQGSPKALLETNRDVTDRKLAEEALRSSEERFRLIADMIPSLVWTAQPDGSVDYVNRAFAEYTGTAAGSVAGWIFDPVHPDERAEAVDAWRKSIESGEPSQLEHRLLRADGVYRWHLSRGVPVCDGKGRVIKWYGTSTDVHGIRQAQEKLRRSEEMFRTLADNIPQLAWMANPDGWIFWYNQRWYDYTGTTLEQMQGWGWQPVHHPQHLARVVGRFKESLATGEAWEDTFPLRGRDGQFRWFLSRAMPIRDAAGKVVRWFGTNTDITGQKRTEEALRRSNADLEQFAYVASHDLQEPLRTVAAFTQLLARGIEDKLDDKHRQYVDLIVGGARKMSDLISDLLLYSQMTSGEQVPERVDAAKALQTAIENLRSAIEESGARIVQDTLPTVRADRLQLTQVFQNLLSNAVKYRQTRVSPEVRIAAEKRDGEWLFSVRDNGRGFEPEYADRIFGIFKRLHRDGAIPGTGIGLAICKTIVERHGGRIWAEAQTAQGATIYFTLPAAE